MKKNYILFVLLIVVGFGKLTAQNDLKFTNVMFNELTFNPAIASSTSNIMASLDVRSQWTGFPQGPKSQFFNAYSTVPKIGGIGLTIINDKLGFEKSITARASYAHKLKLSKINFLTFGASVGILNRSIDFEKLTFEESNDQTAINAQTSQLKPDFGFGATLVLKDFNFSVSSTHLTQSLDKSTFYQTPRHYYIYTYYKIKASDKVQIIPSVFVKSSEFTTQFELNTNVYYDKKFWLGATYRHGANASALVGFNITQQISLGYAFDYNYGPAKSYSSTSHEIMLIGSFKGFGGKVAQPFFR